MAKVFAPNRGSVQKSPKRPSEVTRNAQGGGLGALQRKADSSVVVQRLTRWSGGGVAQRQPHEEETAGGLPAALKGGVESLSGVDMSDVKVQYNSSKPAQIQAHAYAQGTDIHLAAGQEKHLPHEAWHVAQQKQGRVQATTQMRGVSINDDAALEREADTMGAKAASAPAQMVEDTKDG
ncbi:DUF4157 domain-containing protein [uncultured Roseobacter sp.]|uniref:DUF4157 domain-containing protein n=1 Tax=uncultured Roseobacter sp. TaxID=114847 RepID=UPI00260792F2|nr:DUF4157 domain-containing protein [uncultured Roseobacter sp.]